MPLLFTPTPVPFVPHAPSWRQPLHLHLGPLWHALERELGTLTGRVLDIGCGSQPYRALLGPTVVDYVGLERPGDGPVRPGTVHGDASALPFERESFDAVLSTQVFEHLPDPALALREAIRVLRPGGRLVLTVPGVWPAHEVPHDHWRFTRHGLEALLSAQPMESFSVSALGGLWAIVGQLTNLELQHRRHARELVPIVNLVSRWLDRRASIREEIALAWFATGTRAR